MTTLAKMKPKANKLWLRIERNWVLYLFLLPALVYVAVFNYAPMAGVLNAFKDYKGTLGIWGSPWVGLKHFNRFFESYQFGTLLRNTVTLSLYLLIASFPFPIILAMMLKYATLPGLKKVAQTATYAPHLISVVVACGMLLTFSSSKGLFNQIVVLLGGEAKPLMGEESLYQTLYVFSDVWQHTGYKAVLYIAALASVNPELHEAAMIDGANKFKRVIHVDLPSITPTIVVLLIMAVGKLMSMGHAKSYLLQNSLNLDVSEIISTYSYKIGIQKAQFSYSTAIDMFNNVINLVLLCSVNAISKKLTESSLW